MGFQIQNYRNTAVVFAPFRCGLRVIMGVGEKPIPGMCGQPNIYHSILIFVPNIEGVEEPIREYVYNPKYSVLP